MIINTKGYVIHRKDYSDFDEIITIINEYGNKFSFICLGTRKISSKNARHLNYGDYIEFEFFYSPTKLSKLKSAHTITYLAEHLKVNYTLAMINEVYQQIALEHKKWFELYQTMLLNIMQEVNDYVNLLTMLIMIYTTSGISINFQHCYMCQTPYHLQAIAFQHYGVVCKSCCQIYKYQTLEPALFLAYEQLQKHTEINLKALQCNTKELVALIKQVMIFMHSNLGIYFSDFKALE